MLNTKMAQDSARQQNIRPTSLADMGYGGGALSGLAGQAQANCLQQEPPASQLVSDIHNAILAQEHTLRKLKDLSLKLFGPVPEKEANKASIEMDHVSALIARSRRLAEEIANRLESISSNV